MSKIKKGKNFRKIIFYVIIFVILLSFLGIFSNLNSNFRDNFYGTENPIENIIIINIDEKTLNSINSSWPIDEKYYLKILDKLNESTIGINVEFKYKTQNQNITSKLENKFKNNKIILSNKYLNKANNNFSKSIFYNKHINFGYTNLNYDTDGIVRSVNLNYSKKYNSFAGKIYKNYYNKSFNLSKNQFLINFINPNKKFKTYSFIDVLNNKIDLRKFKNKIVIIGTNLNELNDKTRIPTNKIFGLSNSQIQANILQSMILKNNLKYASFLENFSLILIFSILTIILVNRVKIYNQIIWIIILNFIFFLIAIYYFNENIILNFIYTPIAINLTFLFTILFLFFRERKIKDNLYSAFQKYISPSVVSNIGKSKDKLKLGGSRKKITILFTDIENFTNISEKLNPDDLVNFLTDYFNQMSKIILENNGHIDKYIGDSIMAFWGAPNNDENQIKNVANCAILMKKELKILKQKWKNDFNIQINTRTGIHHGNCFVGNIGSRERFDYTIIGDSVNLASRLESVNKTYGTKIIVSQNIFQKIKNEFVLRELDLIRVKGKNEPVRIYELVNRGKISKNQKECFNLFHNGLVNYRNLKFENAQSFFYKSYVKYNDQASKKFIKRCEILKKTNIKLGWDGIFKMKQK